MTEQEREARIRKAEAIRYQKPMAKELNWEHIADRIYEISGECEDIRWMSEDEEQLVDFLDGDDEKAFEFRFAFGSLAADCEQMMEDMEEIRRYDFMGADISDDGAPLFDLFFPAVGSSEDLYGFDQEIGDYFRLTSYEMDAAMDVAKKKLKRLTKDQLLDLAGMALNVARNYTSIEYRYNSLRDCMDILKEKNSGTLRIVKGLEEAWQKWDRKTYGGKYRCFSAEDELNRQLREIPDRLWIE